tara:strand:+ start:10983 stop:12077 length:1095 start_codon:yes stop_codon:yes gene_type:complete
LGELKLQDLTKKFGEVTAVKDVNLEIKDQEFLVLLGPSGCGKSTTLRMIAGLEDATGGDIFLDGRRLNDVLPRDRNIAMVFQNYALYPHKTVFDNMAFGLQLRRVPKDEIQRRVLEAASILGIEELLKRRPKQLSGGQRQRVAVGRAIVRDPAVFLFDEPLSNLDAKLRVQTRVELLKLHKRLQVTSVYVTHDQIEAMTMGDRIVVMLDATIQQVGTPMEIYQKPANQFVAGFIGSPAMNFNEVSIKTVGDDLLLEGKGFSFKANELQKNLIKSYQKSEGVFGIRPEDIAIVAREDNAENSFGGVVELVEPVGSDIFLELDVEGSAFTARVPTNVKTEVGEKLYFAPISDGMHLFDIESGISVF